MTGFPARVAAVTGVPEARLEPLASGSLSQVLLVPAPGGTMVAKSGPLAGVEAAMLRAIRESGVAAPAVEAEHEGVLLLEHVAHDGRFDTNAWRDVGLAVRRLHTRTASRYGWPSDYAIGSVALDNRETADWPLFWGEQRLIATAALLDRPWRERVERVAGRLHDLLPASPSAALLHGDLWAGNILVRDGCLAGLIDPACYYGDPEVDLAMLELFSAPTAAFGETYGPLEPGWEARRPVYQLFPALVHVRLWGPHYFAMVDRLLGEVGC